MLEESERFIDAVVVTKEDLLRGLLASWLVTIQQFQKVEQFRDVQSFRSAFESSDFSLKIMIVDSVLPDGDGIDIAAQTRIACGSPIPVILLSDLIQDELFERLSTTLQTSWAFLCKSSNGISSMRLAIDAVLDGLVMVDPGIRAGGIKSKANHLLSRQEENVMELVSEGMSNASISDELFVSEKTVERILTSVYAKYGIVGSSKAINPRVRATLFYRGLVKSRQEFS